MEGLEIGAYGAHQNLIMDYPEAILVINPLDGQIVDANLEAAHFYGWSVEKLQQMKISDINTMPSEAVRVEMELARMQQRSHFEFQHRLSDGQVRDVSVHSMPILWGGHSVLCSMVSDVTECRRKEKKLATSEAHLRELNDELERRVIERTRDLVFAHLAASGHAAELKRDEQLAARVQKALLSVPDPSEYLKIAIVYQPHGYVGGDLYFMDWRYDGSLLRGFIVDAIGSGLATALYTASMHVLLREVNELDLPLADAMRWINRRVGDYFDEGTFAGALGFELDLQTRQLRWTCAGIPKTWVATKTMQGALECPGMCLGINEDEMFDTQAMPIDVGDSLYFMTDGLADLLREREALPLERYSEMLDLLWTLSESKDRRDDATAVCIQVRALPQSLVRQDGWPRILSFNGYGDYQRLKSEVANILTEVTGLAHSLQEVVVNEALCNAMECRDGVSRQQRARLRVNRVGNRLIVRVKTSRIAFAGNAMLRRLRANPETMFSFCEDASMGRGIPMMLSMSHKMTYNSEGTEVLMAWKL